MKNRLLSLALVVCGVVSACSDSAPTANKPEPEIEEIGLVEGYPMSVIQDLEAGSHELDILTLGASESHAYAIVNTRLTWQKGQKITVAFNGGSLELRQRIIDATKPWSEAANVVFDFGNPSAGGYRSWSSADLNYRASIRIAFARGKEGGYWSLIGTDSINRSKAPPNKPSMNFDSFDQILPSNWEATVLHEFGHALGLLHEHQSLASPCQEEYRWQNDPGYVLTEGANGQVIPDSMNRKPGLYALLGGAPNHWEEPQVDFNMKRFAFSTDLKLTEFDPASIMKYRFERWMFRDIAASTGSGCFGPAAMGLSNLDKALALDRYPRDPQRVKILTTERKAVSREILNRQDISEDLKSQYRINFDQ